MRDPDEVMAYEAKQQELVEGIMDSLLRETHDDENYQRVFYNIAECIFYELGERGWIGLSGGGLFRKLVHKPVQDFTNIEAERRYLFHKVFEKVYYSFASGFQGDWLHHQLEAEMAR